MPFVVRGAERRLVPLEHGGSLAWVIAPDRLPDRRLAVAVLSLPAGAVHEVRTASSGLAWFQVLAGSVLVRDRGTAGGNDGGAEFVAGPDHIVMASHGRECDLKAMEPSVILLADVPTAEEVTEPDLRCIDWSTEPVLLSEHDSRRRIYLASTGLWGTEAVKGEMIFYPPGAIGAPHHHEGAEHFQFMLFGSATAILGDERVDLHPGDLLYNLENEVHSFENLGDEEMAFVEFFVPGRNTTVWVEGANACAWNPLETDLRGRPAARRLEAHVHGQGAV